MIRPLYEVEKEYVLETVSLLHGDRILAARALGIGKTTLYKWLHDWSYTYRGDKISHPALKSKILVDIELHQVLLHQASALRSIPVRSYTPRKVPIRLLTIPSTPVERTIAKSTMSKVWSDVVR
jgi:hypothetical protein